jgi:tRNA(Ile)-lysidine synthase
MSLLNRFHKSLSQSGCIPTGSRVLVAVSGGADSVALLSLLHQVAGVMELHLEAAHLDHALRDESLADARFVEQLCLALDVPLMMERQDVAELARQQKGNLEEVARNVRRAFLTRATRARNCQLIAFGHHADDQAETFLMRLLRGSGPFGLAGMRMVNELFVRPLLPFQRDDLIGYLQEEGIAWREDESNLDQTFTRNRVRHQLVPVLESFNPNIRRQIAGLCDQIRDDDDFLSDLADAEMTRCGERQGDEYVLNCALLSNLAPALAGRVVREALHLVRGDLRGVTSTHTAEILKLACAGAPQGELDLPGGWVARRYEKLLFCKQKPEKMEPFELVLNGPGIYPLPGGRLLHASLAEKALGERADVVEFSAISLQFPLQVRSCQPGDRLHPSGMSGTKKIQDFFVDLKLTKEERQDSLLLVKDSQVLWVVGLRRSEGGRPVQVEPVLRFEVQKSGD